MRWIFGVIRREVAEQVFGDGDGVLVVLGQKVRVAADRCVHLSTTDFGHGGGATRHRLDDFRASQEHVRILARHDHEVHERGRIRRAAGTGAQNDGNLRHNAGQQNVVVEHVSITGQRVYAFLNASPPRIFESDDRRADFERIPHDAGDLARLHLAERSCQYAVILTEGRYVYVADVTRPRNHAIRRKFAAGHAEMHRMVFGMHTHFLKGTFIEQAFDAFPRREGALGV